MSVLSSDFYGHITYQLLTRNRMMKNMSLKRVVVKFIASTCRLKLSTTWSSKFDFTPHAPWQLQILLHSSTIFKKLKIFKLLLNQTTVGKTAGDPLVYEYQLLSLPNVLDHSF